MVYYEIIFFTIIQIVIKILFVFIYKIKVSFYLLRSNTIVIIYYTEDNISEQVLIKECIIFLM